MTFRSPAGQRQKYLLLLPVLLLATHVVTSHTRLSEDAIRKSASPANK